MTVLGIIGGTGAALFPGMEQAESQRHAGSWGEPSAPVQCWQQQGHRVLFLPRHGQHGGIPPHLVNYRANVQLLHDLGAEQIIALNAVGGIGVAPGHLVVPAQLIDYTWGRAQSYYDSWNGPTEFIEFTEPYDSLVRNSLIKACGDAGVRVTPGGTYGVTQGPRLETAAEVDRLDQDGCSIIGMTGMPEAALARELTLPYACLALVVNAAAGRSEANAAGGIHAAIEQHIAATMSAAGQVVRAYLSNL